MQFVLKLLFNISSYVTFDKYTLQNISETHVAIYGLHYKHVMIINDDSSIVNKWKFKLIDDARVVIYIRNKFIIQATGDRIWQLIHTNYLNMYKYVNTKHSYIVATNLR